MQRFVKTGTRKTKSTIQDKEAVSTTKPSYSYGAFTTHIVGGVNVIQDDMIIKQWGVREGEHGIISASYDDSTQALLAISKANGSVEIMDPITGSCFYESGEDEYPKSGLHLFKYRMTESSSWILYCSKKYVRLSSYNFQNKSFTWITSWDADVNKICCSAVAKNEERCVFAGKTNGNLCMWQIEPRNMLWKWKSEETRQATFESDSEHRYTNVSSITFSDDDQKIVAGTNSSKVWCFDIPSARHDEYPIDKLPKTPVNAVIKENSAIYFGTGLGYVALIDTRAKGVAGEFSKGGNYSCGSVKHIARHPEDPILASAGLDGYLRIWDIRSTDLLTSVHVKDKMSAVFFGKNAIFAQNSVVEDSAPPTSSSKSNSESKSKKRGKMKIWQ